MNLLEHLKAIEKIQIIIITHTPKSFTILTTRSLHFNKLRRDPLGWIQNHGTKQPTTFFRSQGIFRSSFFGRETLTAFLFKKKSFIVLFVFLYYFLFLSLSSCFSLTFSFFISLSVSVLLSLSFCACLSFYPSTHNTLDLSKNSQPQSQESYIFFFSLSLSLSLLPTCPSILFLIGATV